MVGQEHYEKVASCARALMRQGYHCSEAFLFAVGEYKLGNLDDRALCMATGLAGGVGGTHAEMCGGLSAGVMIIGALYGRTTVAQDDQLCYRLSKEYREKFIEEFGASQCQALRDINMASGGEHSCPELIYRAVLILLELLEKQAEAECVSGSASAVPHV